MSANKWTPGPWSLGNLREQEIDINCGAEPRLNYTGWDGMATVFGSEDSPHFGVLVMMANARLIAAAPDLAEALDPEELEAIADEIGEELKHSARAHSLRIIAKKQRAALAKARGEE